LFCPIGQNELDINECDAQIPHILKNLRSPNEVRGNNRLTAVIADTLLITGKYRTVYVRHFLYSDFMND